MSFRDLDEVLVQTPKHLPISGKVYDFPDRVSAETGLLLLRMTQTAKSQPNADLTGVALELVDAEQWEQIMAEVLGRSLEDLVAEGVRMDQAVHVFKTLLVWHVAGQAAAEKAWETADPTGAAPANRAARRASKSTRSTGKVPSTRSAASPAGSSTNGSPPPHQG